jgi:Ca2+/Na+ antiporter
MGEAVRRCDPEGRSYRQLLQEEELTPLGMSDTAIGRRSDLAGRHIFPDFRGKPPQEHLGRSNHGPQGAFMEEQAEMPWVGGISTVPDLLRLAEMYRRGGELDGKRILSPAMIELAVQNWTGDKPNELYKAVAINHGWEPYPAFLGLGFCLRGDIICPGLFGTLTPTSCVLLLVAGLAALVMGSELLVHSAGSVARAAGVSDLVIGLTVVAFGTSAPELVTSLVALRRGEADLAVGNVFGSNVFNVLGVLGATCIVEPQELSRQVLVLDAPVMLLASAAMLPAVFGARRSTRPHGGLLVAGYAAYTLVLWFAASRWFPPA